MKNIIIILRSKMGVLNAAASGLRPIKICQTLAAKNSNFLNLAYFFLCVLKEEFLKILFNVRLQLCKNNRPQSEREIKMIYIIKHVALIALILTTFGCQKKENIFTVYNKKTPSFVSKSAGVSYHNRMESTPVVYRGEVLDVIFNRQEGMNTDIYNSKNELMSRTKLGVGLGSAMVYDDSLIVAGSTGWETTSPLKIYRTTDLHTYEFISEVHPSIGKRIFNSSIIFANNEFILTTEEDTNGDTNFNPVFYRSSDLRNWTKISELKFSNYIACPTLRYVSGYYYVFYLLNDKDSHLYYTSVSRSLDLVKWVQSNQVVISPESESEGQNTSDIDFYELNGQVVINYVIGNQEPNRREWSDIKRAYYSGTLEMFVLEFFK